jgi:hypothetical protein
MTEPTIPKPETPMHYRSLSLRRGATDGRPATLDEKSRSVEVIGATEEPVEVFDFQRWELVREVLLMDGLELPKSRQVPLLDSHSRYSTAAVLGSYRDMIARNGQLTGRVLFSTVPEAEGPYTKLREGHLTDFSAGYRIIQSTWIEEGQSATIRGRSFNGPLRVTDRWRIKELSVTPIGADELATARSERSQSSGGPTASATPQPSQQGKIEMTENIQTTETETAVKAERMRIGEIEGAARSFNYPDDLTKKLVDGGVPTATALRSIMDHAIASKAAAGPVGYRGPANFTYGADDWEKRSEAMTDALVMRAGVRLEKPADGAADFRGASLPEIAKNCLEASGQRVSGMSKNEIVSAALTGRAHQTADFPSLLANTGNKVLRLAYEQAPGTFAQWVKQTDARDFNPMSRTQLSEAPDLDQVPEHGEFVYGKFLDSKETFQVYKYGKLFAVTREALVNDDLAAFTRIPLSFAMSAKRKINAAVYSILTTNAAMADGLALFEATYHKNLIPHGSGAAPSTTTLSAARLAMRLQTGLNGAVLNIAPRYLIVGAGLETVGDVLLNSTGALEDEKSSAVVNPFYKKLELVVDSLLDAASPVWFVAADPAAIDTIEVAYLDGRREPYLETRQGWAVDGVEYKVRIEFGCAAIDHRGFYMNDGN